MAVRVEEDNKQVEAPCKCQGVEMYEKFSAGTDIITYLSQKVEGSNFSFFVVHFENRGREGYMLHQNSGLIS